MKFTHDARVSTADGHPIGHIDRVVLDPQTRQVTNVVIRKGLLFPEDRVASIRQVAVATEEHIQLREDVGDLHNLPKFEETQYVGLPNEPGPSDTPISATYASALLWYPLVGTITDAEAAVHSTPQVIRNVPAGTVALRLGARVMAEDGKLVGWVDGIITDTLTRKATHIWVSRGLLTQERKLILILCVRKFDEYEVCLATSTEVVALLRPYSN